MSRPLRIEFPGAMYHVTSRGDRREPIYRDDADRLAHQDVLAQAMDRFDASVLAYGATGSGLVCCLKPLEKTMRTDDVDALEVPPGSRSRLSLETVRSA